MNVFKPIKTQGLFTGNYICLVDWDIATDGSLMVCYASNISCLPGREPITLYKQCWGQTVTNILYSFLFEAYYPQGVNAGNTEAYINHQRPLVGYDIAK